MASPGFSAPTGSSNPVNVVFGRAWQFVVDYMRQKLNVDATRQQIGSDQNPKRTRFKLSQSFSSGALTFFAVN